ncbi:MAG: methyl-accepting chemotaxis protein [Steroidobacteraceae bacterium]
MGAAARRARRPAVALESLAPRAARDRHSELLAGISKLRTSIADHYNITLDPAADTYYMLDAAVQKVPELEIAVGRMRSDLGVALGNARPTIDDWRDLAVSRQHVRDVANALGDNIAAVTAASPAGKAAAGTISGKLATMRQSIDATLAKIDRDVPPDAPPLVASAAAVTGSANVVADLDDIHDAMNDGAAGILGTRAKLIRQQRLYVVGVTIVGVGFSLLLLVMVLRIVRMSANSDAAMRMVVQAALDGDLAKRADWQAKTVFAEQVRGVNALMDKMEAVIKAAHGSASAVVAGMTELTQSNSDLGARTESAASSLEETAASMEQMTATVAQNAENARQAHQLASTAREQAEQGGAVVKDAVAAMNAITDSSSKIAEIVGVIDDIAFQTNLLALNAAVEAARAGEQGRGFAVVASEVRSLASRSATAAREIKSLITDSVAKVQQGAQLVEASGERLGEIMRSVKKVTDVVAEISNASGEQSAGISQVNEAVMQLDQMTQGNAGFIDRSTHMAADLKVRCEELLKALAYYVRDARVAQAAAPATAAANAPGRAASAAEPAKAAPRRAA